MPEDAENNNRTGCFLLYDGTCPLCIRITGFLKKTDRKSVISFLQLNSREAEDLLNIYGYSAAGIDSVVFIDGTGLSTRSEAVLKVFKAIGGLWSAMYVFIFVPKGIRDYVYKLVARNRFRFYSKKCEC